MSDPDWRSLPSLSALRAFETVARRGSFSAAARDLNVTHAAVAQHVRALETDVGAQLVQRNGRGLALTPAGRQLAGPMREGFSMLAQGVEALRQTEASRGVRATTTTFIVGALILPRLPDFWRTHPEIQISFVPGPCLAPVDFDGFDLGIRVGKPEDWPNLVATPLITCETVFVAAPALANSGRAPQDLPWITGGDDSDDERVLAEAGLDVSRLDIRDIGDQALEIQAAKRGIGAITATDIIVQKDLEEGSLVRLDLQHPDPAVYQVITPKGRLRPPVQRVIDWLREDLAS
ncbi:MAG: LysR substrate-binding domain-containing protein [Pseudomonadota bacterium]